MTHKMTSLSSTYAGSVLLSVSCRADNRGICLMTSCCCVHLPFMNLEAVPSANLVCRQRHQPASWGELTV